MSIDWSTRANKIRALLLILAAWAGAVLFAWPELRYVFFGKTVAANVGRVLIDEYEDPSAPRTYGEIDEIEVFFHDGNVPRTEFIRALPGAYDQLTKAGPNVPPRVAIQYIPGSPGLTRMKGDRDWRRLILLAAAFIAGGYFAWKALRARPS